MYDRIYSGLVNFAGLLTSTILVIIAITILAVFLVVHIALTIFARKLSQTRRFSPRSVEHLKKNIRRFSLVTGWIFFALSLMALLVGAYGNIVYINLMHMFLAVIVLSLLYLMNFIFSLFRICRCCCCGENKEDEKRIKKAEIILQEEIEQVEGVITLPASKPKKSKPVVAQKQKQKQKQKPKKPVKVKAQAVVVHEDIVTKPLFSPGPKEEVVTVQEIAQGHTVQTTTKQTVEKTGSVTSSVTVNAKEATLYSDGTVTGTSKSVTKKTSHQLKAEHDNLKKEYAQLEKQLEQARKEKLQLFGSSKRHMENTLKSGAHTVRKEGKFDEAEVRLALIGLKRAMDDLQGQIDKQES